MSSGSSDWRRWRLCDVFEGGRRRRRSRDASRAMAKRLVELVVGDLSVTILEIVGQGKSHTSWKDN